MSRRCVRSLSRKAVSLIRTRASRAITKKKTAILGFANIGIGQRFMQADFLVGKNNVDGLARLGGGTIEKDIETRNMPVDKSGGFQSRLGGVKVFTTDQNVNVLSVADCGLVDAGNLKSYGVTASHRIRYFGGSESGRCPQKTLAHFFHRVNNPFQREWPSSDTHKGSAILRGNYHQFLSNLASHLNDGQYDSLSACIHLPSVVRPVSRRGLFADFP